ncbi:hypothetical protein IE53DRAFT_385639 [Violaceomyces palustris]|uniref:Uncharacterized protein n=1 Tax=Violaceomyces palustris TaxID=1673888 RepID=A0ACD0P1J7_9BASI|nr:hypothetical protein IE53DRAFT_385639 [Violaceomyces palustris]
MYGGQNFYGQATPYGAVPPAPVPQYPASYASPPPLPQPQAVAPSLRPPNFQMVANAGHHHDPLTIASDPNAFAAMFREHLSSLTFNSKPIITNLTIIAHEHVLRMANVVAKCLDDHIMQSHPSIRLPALYLLDSICKNIGAPYTVLWAERVVPLFLETYRLVDQPTKMRMEELLATWKEAGPGGRPLFNENAQWSIERSLFGSQGMPAPANKSAPAPQPAARSVQPPTAPAAIRAAQDAGKARAIESIERLLVISSQEMVREPGNAIVKERMDSLRQLKQVLLTTTLSSEEMNQVHAQLSALTAASNKRNPQLQLGSSAPTPVPALAAVATVTPPAPTPAALSIGNALASLSSLTSGPANQLSALSSLSSQPTPLTAPSPAPAPAPVVPDVTSSLIASLMQAGLLPSSNSNASTPIPARREEEEDDVDEDQDYVNAIMSLEIKTSGPGFSKEPPAIELLLHKHLPLQCRQCANRYPKSRKGQNGMDQHLDWHFTQNRRAKDSVARGQSRSWLDKLQSWIRGGYDDVAPSNKDQANGQGGEDGGPTSGSLSAAQEKAMKEKFAKTWVIAPTDADKSSKPCPICKESFKSEWSEEEEDWLWMNAMEVDGTYYHASCHYSAKILSESVITRRGTSPPESSVGGGVGSRKIGSRSATPLHAAELSLSTGTKDPVARVKEEEGVANAPTSPGSPSRKRKLEEQQDEGGSVDEESMRVKKEDHPVDQGSETPPAKKAA